MLNLWDDSKDFEHHLKMAEKYQKEGKECARRGDLEGAFIKLTQAVTLMAEKLPMHQDYNVKLNSFQQTNIVLVSIFFSSPFPSSKFSLSAQSLSPIISTI